LTVAFDGNADGAMFGAVAQFKTAIAQGIGVIQLLSDRGPSVPLAAVTTN
jgi:hypothetical protein